MKRWVLRVLKGVLVAATLTFVVLQFFGPAKSNPATDPAQTIEAQLQVTPEVASILDRSCNDCHSNKTRWPWYSNVAPVSNFVIDHVNEGREELNFSQWGNMDKDRQARKLRKVCEEVKDGAMPLSSYTPLHPGSNLSAADVKTLCDWTNSERARISQ
jgi:hypothetical protein